MSNLKQVDPEVKSAILCERKRQQSTINLIASENYVSTAVLEAQGSLLTNKYAEGYPSRRYYGGCENADTVETLAIDRAKKLFGAEHANVQPHSGAQANMAAYFALLHPGDKVVGMSLTHGGHLTHGAAVNFSGRLYQFVCYGVNQKTELIDYDEVERLAVENKPALIVAGASAYPRVIDFARFKAIADKVKARLLVDMAHIAGLVAAGLHPSPVPYADIVSSTTHKTLRGPRGGFLLTGPELASAVDSSVFPGIQGGPLMHIIAAKAVSFHEAMQPEFTRYQQSVLDNARAMAAELQKQGLRLVSGGTDNHLTLVDLTPIGISGQQPETALQAVCIIVNKNANHWDKRPPQVTSGIRIGTSAISSRGCGVSEMKLIGGLIVQTLRADGDGAAQKKLRSQVQEICRAFPMPG